MDSSDSVYQNLLKAIHQTSDSKSSNLKIKSHIGEFYRTIAKKYPTDIFLNWGLYDEKLTEELLTYQHPLINRIKDIKISSAVLAYFLVRPLATHQLFNRTILDIGCGNGSALAIYQSILKPKQSYGLDLSPWLLGNAQINLKNAANAEFINGDAEALPFEDNSIDIITSLESSHLYPNIKSFYNEVFRVIKPGGFFCYADFRVGTKKNEAILEQMINDTPRLEVVLKQNITKKVQKSIYNHLVGNEQRWYQMFLDLNNQDATKADIEFSKLAQGAGALFLPWWKKRFKNAYCNKIVKSFQWQPPSAWKKKYYYYYLVRAL